MRNSTIILNPPLIKLDKNCEVIDDLINNTQDIVMKKIYGSIKFHNEMYKEWLIDVEKNGDDESSDDTYPESEITIRYQYDKIIRELMDTGFGIKVYDDSNEYSDDFTDKVKISWEWEW